MTIKDEPAVQTPCQPSSRRSRFGFMKGKCKIRDDFDTMCQAEIEEMFYGSPIEPRTDDAGPVPDEPPRKP